jgi:hypothetical protein
VRTPAEDRRWPAGSKYRDLLHQVERTKEQERVFYRYVVPGLVVLVVAYVVLLAWSLR